METNDNIREVGERAADAVGVSRSMGRKASYGVAGALFYSWVGVTQAAASLGGVSRVSPSDVVMAPLQLSEVGSAICDSPLGYLLSLGFAALAIYFLYGGIVNYLQGLDKENAVDEQTQREGEQHKRSAKGSAKAFLAVVAIPIVLELAGVYTLSCVAVDAGLIERGALFLLPLAVRRVSGSDEE